MTSSLELEDDDGFTKIVDLDVPRVDLVDRAANGTHFLLTKSEEESADAGLLSTDQVRALAKATTELEEPPVSEPIVKDNLDPTEPLVGDSPSAQTPGSPEWEQVDHDTAQKFISILNFAQYAITQLSGREAQEGTAGDEDGWDNSWDLEDATFAIQYAIDTLAVYAAGEAAEIEIADMEKAAAVVKALQPLAELDLVSAQSAVVVRKSGRVLSTSNETLLRNAVESITKVLASLPVAPETEEPVAKNETPADEVAKTAPAPVEPTVEPVTKADDTPADGTGDALVVVFPANSAVPLGVVKEGDIIPVKGTSAPEAEPEAPVADAAVDAAAAPKDAVGVAKGEEPAGEVDFTKELADLRALVKSQGDDLEFLKSPARPRVAMNGVTPKGPLPLPEHNRQGDDVEKAATALTDEEAADLKKIALHAPTEAERSEARQRLTEATTASWLDVRKTAAAQYQR